MTVKSQHPYSAQNRRKSAQDFAPIHSGSPKGIGIGAMRRWPPHEIGGLSARIGARHQLRCLPEGAPRCRLAVGVP